jgi:hypothetical protein
MPVPANYKNLAITADARASIDNLIVALTTKYRRRFTISEAIKQAAEDVCREAYSESDPGKYAHRSRIGELETEIAASR